MNLISPLLWADMREQKIAAQIARELGKFHKVDIPGSKEPQLWVDILKFYEKGYKFIFVLIIVLVSFPPI